MDLDEIEGTDEPKPTDFRRSQGAPLVRSPDGSGRWLRYARPSGFGHDLDDESALNAWRLDRAIEGVATTPSLAADIAANVGRKEGRKDRREKAISVGRGEEAADLGTALHAMAHRLETDPGFRAPEPYASDLAAYLMAIDSAGLQSTHCEVHVCADPWRAAGTADRIYLSKRELRLPDGGLAEPGQSFIGDLKTGKKLDYNLPGFAIQLAIYADGCFYDVTTDERTSFPDKLRTDWGILAHLPVGTATCTLWWVDLQVGRDGARIVKDVRAWRKRDDFAADFVFPQSDEVAVLTSPIFELEQSNDEPASDEWRDAMLPWAQDRINQIGQVPEARALLLRRWPESVAPFRTAAPTSSQLALVLDLLDTVESAFNLPFPEGDPRVEWNRGLHSSEVIRNNEPRSHIHEQ